MTSTIVLGKTRYIVVKTGDDKGEQRIFVIPKNRVWMLYFNEEGKFIVIRYGNTSDTIKKTTFANFKKIVKEIYGENYGNATVVYDELLHNK